MADLPRQLGRYLLLERIATGGSAEIYRGLHESGGIQRLVAIKCVHAAHADNESFLKFFRSEINLTLGFNHPGIVRTLDFGEEDGRPFIVFEYVHGRSLRQITDRLAEQKKMMPISLATFICEQAAGALHYAHDFQEPVTGRVLNIIHRDISPQNIMVSYDGVPKLIDFGIAKVLQDGDRTIAGFIKGKPAYLSPEQASGQQLDARSDVFALGIVLWELLAGRRLFGGPHDKQFIMQAIVDPAFAIDPPSKHDRRVPQTLDEIALRALERDRNYRYQSARDMQTALWKLLSAASRHGYVRKAALLMSQTFAQEIEEEAQGLKRLSTVAEELTNSTIDEASWLIPMPKKRFEKADEVDDLARKPKAGGEDFTYSTNLIQRKLDEKASGVRELEFGAEALKGEETPALETVSGIETPVEQKPPEQKAPDPRPPEPVSQPAPRFKPKAEVWPRPQRRADDQRSAAAGSLPSLASLSKFREKISRARDVIERKTLGPEGSRDLPSTIRTTMIGALFAGGVAIAFLLATNPAFKKPQSPWAPEQPSPVPAVSTPAIQYRPPEPVARKARPAPPRKRPAKSSKPRKPTRSRSSSRR
jgi:serine/threonine protein kinase